MKRFLFVVMVVMFGASSLAAKSGAKTTKFLAFGDMPYGKNQILYLEAMADKLKATDIAFALFYGDMKSGGKKCSQKRYKRNFEAIFNVTNKPVFLTLGDNDWTDCDRKGDNELLKLIEVRKHAFQPSYLPEARTDLNITRDDTYPELVRFQENDVFVSTVHIVGTGNGREEIVAENKGEILDAVTARDAKNLSWLNESFADAENAKAFVLFIHADITKDSNFLNTQPCNLKLLEACDPFANFLYTLEDKAKAYKKPVLLIHGSTGVYCVQSEFMGIENLTRFNGPGDGVLDMSIVGWDGTRFMFSSVTTGKAVKTCK